MPPVEPIRVLAADDHPLLREALAALIESQPDLMLVGTACDGAEAVELHRLTRPDVTLMDLQMKKMSGLDAILAIREEFPAARIIVLTTYHGDVLAKRALKAGARAYLLKDKTPSELVDTIRSVHAGQRRIDSEVAGQIAEHTFDEPLSEREIAVLSLIAEGQSNKMIGRRLDITEGTIKTHVRNILAKLHANDRTHATTIGFERGIIGMS